MCRNTETVILQFFWRHGWDFRNAGIFCLGTFLLINPICISAPVPMFFNIWIRTYLAGIRTYLALVTAESMGVFRHLGVLYKSTQTTFFITPKNCIFWGGSFEPIKNLASLGSSKLQGFYGTPLYHCYTLTYNDDAFFDVPSTPWGSMYARGGVIWS